MDMAGPDGNLTPIEVAKAEIGKATREAKLRVQDEDRKHLVKGWDAESRQRIYNTFD